jgi:hypothetical protein
MRKLALVAAVAALTGALASEARADGLPVLGVDVGPVGVVSTQAEVRFVTLRAGPDTLVARVEVVGGRVLRSRLLPGRFTVPAVAYDGSAAGLSADGGTLVLIRPRTRFPRADTALAILDAERLRLRKLVTLRGDFSFDAVSPRGSWLYLVEYLSPRDPTRYLVRLYNLRAGRLVPEPIIDPREVGDVMRGSPITRAASPDGRWAYTLYDGAGEHPFIHALDTTGRTARCIDLHDLMGHPNLYDLRLDVDAGGGTIAVRDGNESLVVVDARTFDVAEPSAPPEAVRAPAPQATARRPAEADDLVPGWWIFLAAGAGLGLLAAAGRRALARTGRCRPTTAK